MIDSQPLRSMSISPLKSGYFKLWPWNYKVKVMGEAKVQGHIVYPVSERCTSFPFHINRTNHSWDMSNTVFDFEKTYPKFLKKIWQKNRVAYKIPPKYNQVISMTRGISLPSFVEIGGVVLTSSCRQANFCLSMSQPWPWVKVTKGSSNTFSQTYTFFVPNI